MKQIARMISVSMLLLMCSVVMMAKSADDIVVVASVENGTVTASVTAIGSELTCTLTVTPAQGYYIRMSDITVRKTISPALLGARAMSSESKNVPIATDLTLSGDDPADLSTERQYTFTVPEGYGAYVTATFMARKALTVDMVKYNSSQQTYTGVGVTPIYLVDGGKPLTNGTDYTIAYDKNVDATGGVATAEATITGISAYMGTLTPTFVIFPAQITSVEWGDDPKNPIVKCGNDVLEKGTDYDVKKVELRKVTVTGKGNYTNGGDTFEHPISAFDGIQLADCNYTVTPITTSTPGTDSYLRIWEGTSFTPTVGVSYSADDNVDIKFEKGTDYTVTILDISSSEHKKVTEISGPGTYNLVVTEKVGSQRQYSLTYEVKAYTMSFAVNQAWAAYCSDLNLSLPEGVAAYVITGIGETAATAAQIDYIPANTAVLLHREASATAADFTATAYSGTVQTPTTNLLKVAPAAGMTVDDAEIYVLYKNEFVLASAGNLPAGRVYLPVSAVPEETSGEDTDSRLLIVIDDEATAIENRQLPTANRSADSWYSLDGRRLDGQPAGKGVYIYKGKKVNVTM